MKFNQLIFNLSHVKKIVVSDQKKSLTGIELVALVDKTAEELKLQGFGDGKSVIFRMANNVDCIVTFLALVYSGSTVFVSNPHDPIQNFCDNIKRFKPFALLADQPSISAIGKRYQHIEDYSRFDLPSLSISATLFRNNHQSLASHDSRMAAANVAVFSSGSTGEPKAILHSIENLLDNAQMHVEAVDLRESDIVGITLPLYYSYGLVANLLASLSVGAKVCLHYQTGIVDCDWIIRDKITFIGLTPYFASTLQKTLPGLRVMTLGGDVLQSKLALKLMHELPNCQFYSTYGLTEAGPRVATWKFNKRILDVCETVPLGIPLRDLTFFLKDENGNSSDSGELLIKTPTRMIGYYFGIDKGFDLPEDEPNMVHTDDLFERRNNQLYFIGRKKQIIVQGGEKIFPVALESAITKIDGVIEAKVGSVPDSEKGIVAKAYIVADNSVSLASINRILLGQFTRSLIPAKLEFVDSIARTLTGKIA